MLVDNKFIFVSLPRSASTSFYITCLKKGIKIEHYDTIIGLNKIELDVSHDNEYIADNIQHAHERLTSLEKKFGNQYDVISVRRDRHERFLSLWKHVIDETHRMGDYDTFERFTQLEVNDILFYNSENLVNIKDKVNIIKRIVGNKKFKDIHPQISAMVNILITPSSQYHNNDPRIKWFDFKKLNELEEWVSNKLEIEFKLEQSNSSKHFNSKLSLDETFIRKYNQIYDIYDIPKVVKTLI
jgi:hypothetical protein